MAGSGCQPSFVAQHPQLQRPLWSQQFSAYQIPGAKCLGLGVKQASRKTLPIRWEGKKVITLVEQPLVVIS